MLRCPESPVTTGRSQYLLAMARTFYDVMMISTRADREIIVAVYRHLAKRYHPDVDPSPEAEQRMAELNEAYATLSDREKRARYDEAIGLRLDDTMRVEKVPTASASRGSGDVHGEAGPPPVNPAPSGSALTFGRYRGWTLNQVGRYDRDYLEWLSRTTMGRNYTKELQQLLRRKG